jgi:hypothetical protein
VVVGAWIALLVATFGDEQARETLKGLSFPERELENKGRLLAAYGLDGNPAADPGILSVYAGVILRLIFGENPNDHYAQKMAWFATAVVDGAMSNMWKGEEVINWGRALKVVTSKGAEGE